MRLGVQDFVDEVELASSGSDVGTCVHEVAGGVLGFKEAFELAPDGRLGSREGICGAVDEASLCHSVHAVDFQKEARTARHVVDESGKPRLGCMLAVQQGCRCGIELNPREPGDLQVGLAMHLHDRREDLGD